MMKNLVILVLVLAVCAGAVLLLPSPASRVEAQLPSGLIELACPPGASPVSGGGMTVNASTGKYRQWECVDWNGNVTLALASGSTIGGNAVCLSTGANCPVAGTTAYNNSITEAAANVPTTTLITAPASDTSYLFEASLDQTVATAGCSTQPQINVANLTYTDAGTNATRSPSLSWMQNSGAITQTPTFLSTLSTATTFPLFATEIRAKASTAIQFTATYSAGVGCTTGATYTVYLILVQH